MSLGRSAKVLTTNSHSRTDISLLRKEVTTGGVLKSSESLSLQPTQKQVQSNNVLHNILFILFIVFLSYYIIPIRTLFNKVFYYYMIYCFLSISCRHLITIILSYFVISRKSQTRRTIQRHNLCSRTNNRNQIQTIQ